MNGLGFLAQLDPKSFFNAAPKSNELYMKVGLGLFIGFAIIGICLGAPVQMRNRIVGFFTFLAGLPYVLYTFFPLPIARGKEDAPSGPVENLSFIVKDSIGAIGDLGSILAAFILLLGVISLFRYHLIKVAKQQKDWGYSVVLIVSLLSISYFGYADWLMRQDSKLSPLIEAGPEQWKFVNYGKDLLFDGMLQIMDGAMFSIIAFYILSAAYRAFRLRSIEATVLLFSAFIMMLSLLGGISLPFDNFMNEHGLGMFTLKEIAGWMRVNLQGPAIRGIDFGVGLGLVAMGLRIWLNLEKTGGSN